MNDGPSKEREASIGDGLMGRQSKLLALTRELRQKVERLHTNVVAPVGRPDPCEKEKEPDTFIEALDRMVREATGDLKEMTELVEGLLHHLPHPSEKRAECPD